LAICLDAAAVALSNLAANRQANTGAFVLAPRVQARERLKDTPGMVGIEANAIICHTNVHHAPGNTVV
jgi:hypothetical protein